MSLVATTRKLGISFFEYVRDRITGTDKIESLAQIIYNKQASNLPDWSWQKSLTFYPRLLRRYGNCLKS
jgi:hypothetical protein